MRVCTWNVRRAIARSRVWPIIHQLAPDVLVLQEVSGIPPSIASEYSITSEHPVTKDGRPQHFSTAVLVRGTIGPRIELTSEHEPVARELARFRGNLFAHRVSVGGLSLRVVSVYSPAWPVDPARLGGAGVSAIKLSLSEKVWATELLWAALREANLSESGPWIVAGDLNSSETFDYLWPGGPSGNKEILDRMAALGLTECLRHCGGQLVPTFRSPRGGKVLHQLDHLFVTPDLAGRLVSCVTGDAEGVFGDAVSDHLPVIADFDLSGSGAAKLPARADHYGGGSLGQAPP